MNTKANRLFSALLILSCLPITACTNQEMYQAVQESRRQECDLIGHQSAREQCKKDYEKSYEEYQEEREQVMAQ